MNQRRQSEKKLRTVSKSSSSIMLPPLLLNRRASQLKPMTQTKDRPKKQLNSKNRNFESQETRSKLVISQKTLAQQNGLTAQAYGIYSDDLTPLTEFNPEARRQIASLTKMMTMLTALKLCDRYGIRIQNTYFRVSINASNTAGTIAELDPKQWITVEDLLYGLMLPSGNDASMVLAENLGAYLYYDSKGESKTLYGIKSLDITGDSSFLKHYIQNFVKQMNLLAKEYQMTNTCFMNPHGLDCKEAYSTVKDLGILTKKVMENLIASKVICCKNYFARLKISIGKKEITYRDTDWINTNRLLWKKGFLGGKTGQTVGAGNCLVSIYENEGKSLYIIVLGCHGRQNRFLETQKLINREILKIL